MYVDRSSVHAWRSDTLRVSYQFNSYFTCKVRSVSETKISIYMTNKEFFFQTGKILIVVRFCTAYASVKEIKAFYVESSQSFFFLI